MMQGKKIKYDVIGLTETRRRLPLNAVYETGEKLFLGACDSWWSWRPRQHEHRIFRTTYAPNRSLRMRRCGPTPVLIIFIAYAPTSSYEEEEVLDFYMDLEKHQPRKKKKEREDHAFYKVVIGDFNAKVGQELRLRNFTSVPTA